MKFNLAATLASWLALAATGYSQSAGFGVSTIGTNNGVLKVQATDTYYDGNNGTTFAAVPLPAGATHFQFRVTGGVITDGSERLASADGLYANLQTPYDWTDTTYGSSTYNGVPIGGTTGVDPALFGIFFNPGFTGTAPDSLNYRSDSGIVPDPRTLLSYAPLLNQPFYIGDGYNVDNAYVTNLDSHIPPGTIQTFAIPPGATELILGIGADPDMADNVNASDTNSAFLVHVYDDNSAPPVIASVTGAPASALQSQNIFFSATLAAGGLPLSYQWYFHGVALTNNLRIAGAQSNTFTITDAQFSDTGVYQLVVSNPWGTATTSVSLGVYGTGNLYTTNLTVPGNAEIHGAGNAGLPDPSDGVAPVLVNLPPNPIMVFLTNVSGTISLNGGGGQNDADGVIQSGGGYPTWSYAGSYGGISAIEIPSAGAIIGVFEPGTVPANGAAAPAELNFHSTINTNFTSLSPLLYQTFFMGDGLTGDGTGLTQQFQVPQGATELYLGITDAEGFNGPPGGYGDNSGSFAVTVQVLAASFSPIIITNVFQRGTSFGFSVPTANQQSYTITTSTNLLTGPWNYYTNTIGNGADFPITIPASQIGRHFFRVQSP
jgi:hypothetical protein